MNKEYKIYNHGYFDRGNDVKEIENELNKLAKEGWKILDCKILNVWEGTKYPFIAVMERNMSESEIIE